MDIYEALYTTRAMRRVSTEPVSEAAQKRILDAAIRAPSGGNAQNWRFMLVDDPATIASIAPIYKGCIDDLWRTHYAERVAQAEATPDDPESIQWMKVQRSAQWAADHFADYPLLLFGFVQHDPSGGSIYPAIWNAMLAARAEGIGSSLTSVMAFREAEVVDLLGVPTDQGWIMACCVLLGHPTGTWGVAPRRPVHEVSYRNTWGNGVGFEIPEPLWPPTD